MPWTRRPALLIAPLPDLKREQRFLMRLYQAGELPLLATARRLGVSAAMLGRELRGVREMPAERLAALAKLVGGK